MILILVPVCDPLKSLDATGADSVQGRREATTDLSQG